MFVTAYEAHAGSPPPQHWARFLQRVLVRRRDGDDEQPRFQIVWLTCVAGGSDEVIALQMVLRHQGDWRLSPEQDAARDLEEV